MKRSSETGIVPTGRMAFVPLAPGFMGRLSLLVCDACDSVLGRDGEKQKRHSDSDPSDLAPHYQSPDELHVLAKSANWKSDGERWTCPDCSPPAGDER